MRVWIDADACPRAAKDQVVKFALKRKFEVLLVAGQGQVKPAFACVRLIVVGTLLVAEAFGAHVPKGYVYFAMAFSLAVEALNIRMRKAMGRKLKEPVKLGKDLPD